jgi:hypothetical protein
VSKRFPIFMRHRILVLKSATKSEKEHVTTTPYVDVERQTWGARHAIVIQAYTYGMQLNDVRVEFYVFPQPRVNK